MLCVFATMYYMCANAASLSKRKKEISEVIVEMPSFAHHDPFLWMPF